MTKVLPIFLVLLFLCACATNQAAEVIPEIGSSLQPQDKSPITVEVGNPRPLNKVVMLRSMGTHWHRKPPETCWELVSVTFDVKNWLLSPAHLDKAVVKVDGQAEEIPIDIWLRQRGECQLVTVEVASIKDIESGSYPLSVSLESDGVVMCEREDTIKVYWKEM